jgi:hypothetical protein
LQAWQTSAVPPELRKNPALHLNVLLAWLLVAVVHVIGPAPLAMGVQAVHGELSSIYGKDSLP